MGLTQDELWRNHGLFGLRLLWPLGSKACTDTESNMSVRGMFKRGQIEDSVRSSQTGAIFRKSGLEVEFSHFCQDAKIEIPGRFTSKLAANLTLSELIQFISPSRALG